MNKSTIFSHVEIKPALSVYLISAFGKVKVFKIEKRFQQGAMGRKGWSEPWTSGFVVQQHTIRTLECLAPVFMLSVFLNSYVYAETKSWFKLLSKRLEKLWPTDL